MSDKEEAMVEEKFPIRIQKSDFDSSGWFRYSYQ